MRSRLVFAGFFIKKILIEQASLAIFQVFVNSILIRVTCLHTCLLSPTGLESIIKAGLPSGLVLCRACLLVPIPFKSLVTLKRSHEGFEASWRLFFFSKLLRTCMGGCCATPSLDDASWLNILFCGGAMSTVVVSLPVFVVFPPPVSVRHI